jgi:hypothetical protein
MCLRLFADRSASAFPTGDVLPSPWPEKLASLLLKIHQAGDGNPAPMKKAFRLEAWTAKRAVR